MTPPLQFVFNTQLPGRDPHPRERPQFFPSPFKAARQGAALCSLSHKCLSTHLSEAI